MKISDRTQLDILKLCDSVEDVAQTALLYAAHAEVLGETPTIRSKAAEAKGPIQQTIRWVRAIRPKYEDDTP